MIFLFGLALPIADEDKLKDFIVRQLDLKDALPTWRVEEMQTPDFLSIRHKVFSHLSWNGPELFGFSYFVVVESAQSSIS